MPVYTNNVKPVISLAPKGQLTLALYPAESNGAPIEKYMVIVQNTTKNSMSRLKKRDLSSESSKKISSHEVCPHVAKYSYGEHQTSGYYVCAEIKQSMFKLDDVVHFKLGNNKTSFKYSNPSLKSGTYDIWYYAVTKKLAGARSQSCVKLASVKVPLKSWSTQKPEIQYLYQSENSNSNDGYNNQIIFPTSKVQSVEKDENANLTTYLVAIALAFILVVAIVAGYAVFARKNSNTGLQGKLQSKDSSNGGYSNGIVNNGVLAQGGFAGNFGKNDEKHNTENFSHTYDTEPFDSLEKSRIPGFQDSGYQGQHYDNYKGNGGRIPGQISVTEQSDMFDVKIFASDGRLDHSQHSTPVHLANTTRSQESSPLLFDKQGGGYDDSGYPNSLGRGGKPMMPDILNNTRGSPGRSPGRTPTPKNGGGSNQQISHQISNHQISNQMSSPQIHQVQGGVSTPPVFLSGTLQSNSSSIQTRLNNTSSIRVEDFPIAVNQMKTSNICGFTNDFESISNLEGPFEVANRSENRQKNRNQAVVPFDYSRIKLKGPKYNVGSDYINASMVNGYRNPLAYIATQAPLDATVIDFWEMVWGENSRVIVMGRVDFFEKVVF